MQTKPFISVICPVYNEERFIEDCIRSILAQDYPQDRQEILFVDGGSTDRTREIIARYTAEYGFFRLLDNPFKVAPYALNIGIRVAKGDVIFRLDGHCRYPSDYFSVLTEYLEKLDASNVGAVLNTLPAKNTTVCHAIAIASSHVFGVGASLFRTGVSRIQKTDTVPFGCFPREIFDRLGLFDEELVRNQDDEFNGRIVQAGGSIFVLPQVVVDYYARKSLRTMMKMYYQYGLFKPLVNKKLKKPATIRQFVPGLFVAGLLGGLVLSVFFPVLWYVYGAIVALYFLFGMFFGVQQAYRKKRFFLCFCLPWTFFLMHLSYGSGYWVGIGKLLTGGSFKVKESR